MENFLNLVFDNLSDPVFVCNLNYGKTLGNFTMVNESACKKLGYTKNQLSQLNLLSICEVSFEKELIPVIERLIEEGEINFDAPLITKNNLKLILEINSILFELDGKQIVISVGREPVGRKRVEEKLKSTTEQLRNLSSHLQSIREEERTNIAREIHDELGQVLTVLKIQITLLSKKLREDQQDLKLRLESAAKLLDDSVESVQRITSKLRPGILDELGLIPAIEWQAQEFHTRTGINFEWLLPKEEILLEQEKATAIFRIFQEALTNVARHANATRVRIYLEELKNNFILEITDNGKGITMNQINDPKSLGILGMKERALLLGGEVIIKSTMERGTTVKVEIPIDN
ncbi:MAG: histidine kinase [Ignavibacteriales bacterium]|nr:histidine kinase [Ignavibacteriales bacterium]